MGKNNKFSNSNSRCTDHINDIIWQVNYNHVMMVYFFENNQVSHNTDKMHTRSYSIERVNHNKLIMLHTITCIQYRDLRWNN